MEFKKILLRAVPKSTHTRLKVKAAKKEMTIEAIVQEAIKEYLSNGAKLTEVVVCVLDKRELGPFESQLDKIS